MALKATRPSNQWTEKEDEYFLKAAVDLITSGSTLNNVFDVVSKKLGRSIPGCQFRYNSKLRIKMPHDLLNKIKTNNPTVKNSATKPESAVNTLALVSGFSKELNEADFEIEDFDDIKATVVELLELEDRVAVLKLRLKKYNNFLAKLVR